MSWMSQLLKTYEYNLGKDPDSGVGLTPVAHMNVNAHLEVAVSADGSFLSAKVLSKEEGVTLIPVTEASAGRSSGYAPHALCDTLSYVAGDFEMYCKDAKQKKSAEEKFDCYMEQLKKWAESDCTTEKVTAICHYVSQKTMIDDLKKSGIVEIQENGIFSNKKINGQSYDKVLVRFVVPGLSTGPAETWRDPTLIDSYTRYYLSNQKGRRDICYMTGQESIISENHPKGIVAANYGAKLISANDNQGYTYRGRFQNAEQSYALNYEASQKIHSALTWLSKTQGADTGRKDKRMFICWSPNGKRLPPIFDELDLQLDDDVNGGIQINYRRKLKKTLLGYQNQFDESDDVIIIGLDAATTGRLSITYYNEIMVSDFFKRILYWGETCNWNYLKFDERKKPFYQVETPIFRRIVECAFGRENGLYIEVNDKVLKEHTQRLLKCMLEQQKIPFDIVQALTVRASTPLAYSKSNRECVLSTACAVITKYYCDNEIKEVYSTMQLDTKNIDRSYLFGRLLAVYEKIERMTYDRDEKREPNAIRLQSVFANHPFQTWKNLDLAINPYLQKLNPGSREYYRRLISEITESLLKEDEQKLNQGLKETYLLGYYLQRAELNRKKDN